jgi:hypothetical protein
MRFRVIGTASHLHPQRSVTKIALLSVAVAGLISGLTACPGPKFPSGPPPEYEEPPAPSWMRDAGTPIPAPPVLKPVAPDDAGAAGA